MRRFAASGALALLLIACQGGAEAPDSAAGGDGGAVEAGSDAASDAEIPPDAEAIDAHRVLDAGAIRDAETAPDGAAFPDAEASPDAQALTDAGPRLDLDHDGLDDAEEARLLHDYLPFLSIDPGDRCPRSAILYRLRPHPMDAQLLHAIVVVLFERDCGAGGHVGDDEVFGMTIDPRLPPPDGIVALRAIAHQSTACQHISDCGRCPGMTGCTTARRGGLLYPVVFYSTGKHGSYMSEMACDGACFLTNYCSLAPGPAEPPLLNAGEPTAPLTHDLTASGIVTSTAGWTEAALFGYDPWGGSDFGGAGNVASDLADDAFLTAACTP
ncbi:MAG: hypothetical protein U1E65_11700 [Myxococcota bacterium]